MNPRAIAYTATYDHEGFQPADVVKVVNGLSQLVGDQIYFHPNGANAVQANIDYNLAEGLTEGAHLPQRLFRITVEAVDQ